jgi:rhamnosyltransferase
MSRVDISIIILAKNEGKYIGLTLDTIFKQDIDKKYEVIVIDSGSQDSTLEIAKKYPVKIVEIPAQEFGHGRTRNLGAQMADGRIAVFLNADATPKDENWLKSLVANFKNDEKIVGVYSCTYPRHNCNPLDARSILTDSYLFGENKKVKYIKSFLKYSQMDAEEKRKLISFQTISCAVDKNILLKNPFADIPFGEDLEWSMRMLENGFKLVYEPSSGVTHSHNIHSSFILTIKRYFDDAILSQGLLKRWLFLDLLKWLAVITIESKEDLVYILMLKRNLFYKLHWIIYSPVTRMAEFFGILLGTLSFLPLSLTNKLSLVEEIKQK